MTPEEIAADFEECWNLLAPFQPETRVPYIPIPSRDPVPHFSGFSSDLIRHVLEQFLPASQNVVVQLLDKNSVVAATMLVASAQSDRGLILHFEPFTWEGPGNVDITRIVILDRQGSPLYSSDLLRLPILHPGETIQISDMRIEVF